MGLDEARAVLGIAAGAPAEEVRRAYMRAVKRHRPERDPEAFQRAREAYDLLRSPFVLALEQLANTAREAAPSSEPPPAAEHEEPPPEREERVPEVAPSAGATVVAAPPAVDLAPWFEREAALPENAPVAARMAIWREAIEAGVAHAVPSLRYAELVEATRPAEAQAVLVAALRRELAMPALRGPASGPLLGWIAHRYPGALGEADLDALEARGDPVSLAAAALVRATSSSAEGTVPLLERALRGDEAAIGWTLTAVVRLFGADPALGRQAARIVERHLGEAVDERMALRGADATYALVAELAAVVDQVGPTAAKGLARALHREPAELEASLSARSTSDVKREYDLVQRIAPTLAGEAGWIYRTHGQTRPAASASPSSSSSSGSRWPLFAVAVGLLQLTRFLIPHGSTASPPRVDPAAVHEAARQRQAPRPVAAPWGEPAKVVMHASSDQVAEMQRRVANLRRKSSDPEVVAELDTLAKGIDDHDCFEVTASARHVRDLLAGDDDASGLLLVRDAVCAGPAGRR